jgi:hypothetical protein
MKPANLYHTAAAAQAASLTRSLLTTRDRNQVARTISGILCLIGDMDKALRDAPRLVHTAEKYDELLGLIIETGVQVANPNVLLTLEDES